VIGLGGDQRILALSQKGVSMSESLRAEITSAISEGVGGAERVVTAASAVFVAGHDQPIVVLGGSDPDVIVPDSLRELAPGIRLDVQAILADRS
jgi:hypothetical protein